MRRAIGAVLFNAMNFPERAQSRILGENMGPLNEKLTNAVLEAGFRLPDSSYDAQAVDNARAVLANPYSVSHRETIKALSRLVAERARATTVTDEMVEVAWRTYEKVPANTFVMGHWIGKARKRMQAALEAALKPTDHTVWPQEEEK